MTKCAGVRKFTVVCAASTTASNSLYQLKHIAVRERSLNLNACIYLCFSTVYKPNTAPYTLCIIARRHSNTG